MNERIDELAFAAGCHRHKYWDPKHPDLEGFIINQAALDKFAELIAKECMDLVKDCYAEPESGQSPYQTVCASTLIEEHFGVRE